MDPVPVTVLTGFLGSGKTTLLNRLLREPELSDTAVVVNEFGEVAIDHLLVEQSSDGIIELAGGCICCSIRGDLVDTLTDLLQRVGKDQTRRLRRIVIETTGLADPAPILHAMMAHPLLVSQLRLDGVIATVDAINASATLDRHEEAVRQVAMADRIVVTKLDLDAADTDVLDLTGRLKALNPNAMVHKGSDPSIGSSALFEAGLHGAGVEGWLRHEDSVRHQHDHHTHDMRIRSFCLVHDEPIALGALDGFLDLLRTCHGEKLLRLKGIVRTVEDEARPLVIHAVQTICHPPARLTAWPSEDHRSRLVLITIDLPEDRVRALFDAFVGRPSVDAPDRQALENNPLAVPGLTL